MQGNRSRDTAPELALRRAVHSRGLRYRVAVRPLAAVRRTADLVFPRAKVAIFLDGCYWHGCPAHHRLPRANRSYWAAKIERNRERDRDTDAQLARAGWRTLRIWEHDDPKVAAFAVEALVRYGTHEPAGWFTLDGLEADAAEQGLTPQSWPAVRFGELWNGWVTPVVTKAVLVEVLDVTRSATGEPHPWDGDIALIAGPADAPEDAERLVPDPNGHYDLGLLGWTFVATGPSD